MLVLAREERENSSESETASLFVTETPVKPNVAGGKMFPVVRHGLRVLRHWVRHFGWDNWIFVVVVSLFAAVIGLVLRHYGNGMR